MAEVRFDGEMSDDSTRQLCPGRAGDDGRRGRQLSPLQQDGDHLVELIRIQATSDDAPLRDGDGGGDGLR